MKFFYWVVFVIFLATSLGFNLNEVDAAEKYGYTKMHSRGNKSTVKVAPKKIITNRSNNPMNLEIILNSILWRKFFTLGDSQSFSKV